MAKKIWLLGALALVATLYVLSRTQRGQALAADVAGGAAEAWEPIGDALVTAVRGFWEPPARAAPYLTLLDNASSQYGLPPNLLARVAYQESAFREDIISGATQSSAGAQGIMQLVPRFYPGVDPLDPAQAIQAAAQSLANYYRQFGTWSLALAAYNAGPGNVQKYGGVPPFPETQDYVSEITADVGVA